MAINALPNDAPSIHTQLKNAYFYETVLDNAAGGRAGRYYQLESIHAYYYYIFFSNNTMTYTCRLLTW
jgi:hypothetical protein